MLIPDLYYLVPAPNKKASWRLASLLATELARAYKSDLSRLARQLFADEPRFISGGSLCMTMIVFAYPPIAVLLLEWILRILHSLGSESRQRARERRALRNRLQIVPRQGANYLNVMTAVMPH